MIATFLIIAACILLAGYYAGFETGSYCLNRVRLRFRLQEHYHGALTVSRLLDKPEQLISTTLVGHNLFVFLATFALTHALNIADPYRAELYSTIILALPMFLFAEVLPKDLFRRAADSLVYVLAPSFQFSVWLFRPVTAPLKLFNFLLLRLVGQRREQDELYTTRGRLRHFFSESASEGILSAYQNTMANNLMKLREIPVARIMVPLPSVVTLPSNASFDQVRALAEKIPHHRYPVRDADSAVITGVVDVLDLLQDARSPFSVNRHQRRPLYLRTDASLVEALRQLRPSPLPMGLVVDSDGNIVGMITLKDIVEEIVGELGVW